MSKRSVNMLLNALALTGQSATRPQFDALRVPEPSGLGSTLCGITSDPTARGFLLSSDGDPAASGDEKKFSQADLDKIINERLGKEKVKFEEQKKLFTTQSAEFEKIKEQLAELQVSAERAREEGELKGKSELEKLQINFDKATKRIEAMTNEHKTSLAKMEQDLASERNGRVDDAKRTWATQVLSSGAADGVAPYAIQALLSEGQFDIDDKRQISRVTFEGGAYEKPADLAAAFYKARPYFAKAPEGGSNHPRGNGGGANPGNGLGDHTSVESLLSAGMAQRAAR